MRSYSFLLVSAHVYSRILFAPSNALQDGWVIRSRLSTCRGHINSDSMNILGVSCYYHDAAAALLQDGQLIAAAEEERFSRVKHDSSFPRNAIRFCQSAGKIRGGDLPPKYLKKRGRHANRGWKSWVQTGHPRPVCLCILL